MTEKIIYATSAAVMLGTWSISSMALWLGYKPMGVPNSTTYSKLPGWVMVFATCGAIVGFVLKERVGDIAGAVLNVILEAQGGGNQTSRFWLALFAALCMAFICSSSSINSPRCLLWAQSGQWQVAS